MRERLLRLEQVELGCHEREVEEFAHTFSVQLHDGAVGELLEELEEEVAIVARSRLEHLGEQLLREEVDDHIIKHSDGLVSVDALGLETMVDDVDHLAAHVDYEHGVGQKSSLHIINYKWQIRTSCNRRGRKTWA